MKSLKVIVAATLFSIFLPSYTAEKTPAVNDTVYICLGGGAYAFHKRPQCRGLKRCGGVVKAVSRQEAQHSYRPCKICYKH